MRIEDFKSLTKDLRALGGQRVWSLMVSLFGDLAQERRQTIDGPVLSAIMGLLEVKPEATRVALHRLRNDGWISSAKSGRISQHSLTEQGLAQSVAASPRIYANPTAAPENWQIVILPDGSAEAVSDMTTLGFSQISPRVFVGPVRINPPQDTLSFRGTDAPDWLRRQATPSGMANSYDSLHATLKELEHNLPEASELSPIERAVLRCLIVHNWRRLVLRHPPLPAALTPSDWPGLTCHTIVFDLLSSYPRPQLSEIRQQRVVA